MDHAQPGAAAAVPKAPSVRAVYWQDIAYAIKKGFGDFLRAPVYGLFFGGVFALGGLAIVAILTYLDAPWMILPLMIGFPLIGPFAATGLYEVSRRLSANAGLSWKGVLIAVFNQRERQTGWMAFVVLFFFWMWVYMVRILIALFMGFNTPSTLAGFANALISTQNGILFLITGTALGAVLALVLFSATVIAMPLLLDRDCDFVTAMITSFKAVSMSPITMLCWGVVVTLLTILAMLPAFLGLLVVMPVLGHATWHLYKRVTVSGP